MDSELAPAEQRPAPSEVTTGSELLRWYWLKTELVEIARRIGARTTGSKNELTRAVAAALDGQPTPAPDPAPGRSAAARQLRGPLGMDSVIPVGQRCSQTLRAFFTDHIGPSFTFDATMRAFITDRAGATLGDAIAHWHTTRTTRPREIDSQFELNRFTRQWYLEHPGGTRSQLRRAWATYRTTPTDRRRRA